MPASDVRAAAQAFYLFCLGYSAEAIAAAGGVSKRTVERWVSDGGWREGRDQVRARLIDYAAARIIRDFEIWVEAGVKDGQALSVLLEKVVSDDAAGGGRVGVAPSPTAALSIKPRSIFQQHPEAAAFAKAAAQVLVGALK